MDANIDQLTKLKTELDTTYEISLLSNQEQPIYLSSHRYYKSETKNDIYDDNGTYAIVHALQIEGQCWSLIPVDKENNIFEIEYKDTEYDQYGWKLYVPVGKRMICNIELFSLS